MLVKSKFRIGYCWASPYLAELLLKIMEALHARPVVAKLVVLQLSSNPILEPLLAERLLLALAALGVPTEARPKMYQRAMGSPEVAAEYAGRLITTLGVK